MTLIISDPLIFEISIKIVLDREGPEGSEVNVRISNKTEPVAELNPCIGVYDSLYARINFDVGPPLQGSRLGLDIGSILDHSSGAIRFTDQLKVEVPIHLPIVFISLGMESITK